MTLWGGACSSAVEKLPVLSMMFLQFHVAPIGTLTGTHFVNCYPPLLRTPLGSVLWCLWYQFAALQVNSLCEYQETRAISTVGSSQIHDHFATFFPAVASDIQSPIDTQTVFCPTALLLYRFDRILILNSIKLLITIRSE